jgi:hypothetical protein
MFQALNVSEFTMVPCKWLRKKPRTFNVSTPSSKGTKDFSAKLLIAGTTDTPGYRVSGQVLLISGAAFTAINLGSRVSG